LSTFQDIKRVCFAERTQNSDSKVFVLCILSHGERESVYGSDGVLVKVEELETAFDGKHCKQLIGRPKLFLIQACQGGLLFRMD